MAIKIVIKPKSPGYALAVVKNDQILYRELAGLANLDSRIPINQNVTFRLASLSKQFTAMAIMILKERKLLDYDDQLSKFSPDFPNYGDKVTICQLLSHTSGMPDHEQPLYWELKRNPRLVPNIYDSLRVLKQQKQLLFPAGIKFQYSDSGYVLLALIIEKVSGLSYRDFLANNIFKPLNMNNSDVLDDTKPKIDNRAYGYRTLKNGFKLFDFDPLNYIVGDEGVYSSIDDMVKWNQAWTKPVLVSQKTLRQAFNPQRLLNGKIGKAGFSWLITNYRKEKIIYQDGCWVGFRNIILKIPKKNATVIILSNRTDLKTSQQRIAAVFDLC